jgi:hypothetical protein
VAWEKFLADPLVRAALLFAVIAVLAALGALIVARFRGREDEDQLPASEILSKFRELHTQGELSDEEFRNIKTLVKDQLQQELSDSDGRD